MKADSTKPLSQKLGVKTGSKVVVINAPENYVSLLGEFPGDVILAHDFQEPADIIHLFVTSACVLEDLFPRAKQNMRSNGALWVSWPKTSAKTSTDLSENIVRASGLRHGLVDVKVVSISDTWSALKFVYRNTDRS